MKAIEFKEQTIVIAEDQDEYENLPAKVDASGIVTCCFEVDDDELKKVLAYKSLWITRLTFGLMPQPLKVDVQKPAFPVSYSGFTCEPLVPAVDTDKQGLVHFLIKLNARDLKQLKKTRRFWFSTATYRTSLQPIGLSCYQ